MSPASKQSDTACSRLLWNGGAWYVRYNRLSTHGVQLNPTFVDRVSRERQNVTLPQGFWQGQMHASYVANIGDLRHWR